MKDSGVQWIGLIPDDWETEVLKNFVKVNNGKEIEKEEKEYSENAIPVYGSGGIFKYTNEYLFTGKSVMFGRKGTLGKPLYVDDTFWTVDTMYYLTAKENVDMKYIYYQLSAFDWIPFITQTALPSIVASEVVSTKFPFPQSISQQKKIADFLDKKCSEIQSAIDNTKQTIEEYKKLKQAVITKAVTKGIRENRKLKDSGIEWIGQIPEEWEVKRFGRVLNERSEKNNPVKCTERLSCSIDIGVTLYSEKTTNLDRFKDDFTQYKLAHVGDLVMNSMNVIVGSEGISAYYGCVSPAYYTYYDEVEDHYTARFCDYLLKTKGMKRLLFSLGRGIYAIERGDGRINTCRLKVPREDLKAIDIPVPDLSEQKEIVDYLDKYSKKIDTLISQKEQFITELEKYKQSLIYEYVTGKKEVKLGENDA